MHFEGTGLTLTIKTRCDADQAALDRAASALFCLFQAREKEFGVNPGIVVEYPDITDATRSALLVDPVGYVEDRATALERDGAPISRVVVLTTFGDRLNAQLSAAGYQSVPVDIPAGPDFTHWFACERATDGAGRTLYLEAVNETDEKIRPNFVLELRDRRGLLRGGACGAVHAKGGKRFCYLATLTLDTGLAAGTGKTLGEALMKFLREQGVVAVHLGTQTAGPFYEKLGFRVTHRLLRDFRVRRTADGSLTSTDLVMMERAL